VPLRVENSLLPKIGWISDNDWSGFIPCDEMPNSFNPKEGFIVSANHQITDKSYPYKLGDLFRPDYRAQVIHSSLSQEKLFTRKDFEQLQSDLYTLPASILQKIFKERNLAFPNDNNLQELLDEFLNWDSYATLESSGMCIYAAVFLQLVRNLFERYSPNEKLLDLILGKGFGIIKPIQAMICRTHESLFKILKNDNSFFLARCGGFYELLQTSFTQASDLLKVKFGNTNVNSYRWGFLHKYSATHPFSKKLGDAINPEPVECPGSDYAVCVSTWEFDGNFGASQTVGVSWKMILDMASIENGISQIVPGNSCQVSSRFYSNNLQEWANLEYHPLLWTREQVEKASICKLDIVSETRNYCTIN
jgi:penicillin G amidase